jgi:hypothetical protein
MLILFILFGMPLSPVSGQNAQQTTPSYSDTSDGLRDFLRAFIGVIKDADLEKRTRMQESLRIPKAQDWFTTTYGREVGRGMADNYIRNPPQLYPYLDSCNLDATVKIQVSRVEFPDKQSAKLSGISPSTPDAASGGLLYGLPHVRRWWTMPHLSGVCLRFGTHFVS